MDIMKKAFDVAFGLLEIEFVLFGATLSFMEIALFFAFAGVIILFIGGLLA